MTLAAEFRNALNYDDVFIIPQYSDVTSRKEVDISVTIGKRTFEVPVINANMDTIASKDLAIKIANVGGLASLHRFQTVDEACVEFLQVIACVKEEYKNNVFVSIGVNRDSQERFEKLFMIGARNFIIDIAHGHCDQMKKIITWIRKNFPSELDRPYLMAGNVGTAEGVRDLALWGADAVKVGIGPGAVCLTKNVTGVTVPMFSCVLECSKQIEITNHNLGTKIALVADGGCSEIGDVCKAISAGADLVMVGKLFAGCKETPKPGIYRGSASQDVQKTYRSDKEYLPTPEGKSISVELTGESSADIVNHIAGGLRSCYSYCGARNTEVFRSKVRYGIRHNKR